MAENAIGEITVIDENGNPVTVVAEVAIPDSIPRTEEELSQKQIISLRREIETLKSENRELKAEIVELKKKLKEPVVLSARDVEQDALGRKLSAAEALILDKRLRK